MSLDTNIQDGLEELATAIKSMRVMVTGASQGTLSGLQTTAQTSIIAAINELEDQIDTLIAGGSATTLSELTDVTITAAAVNHVLRHNGTNWVNVLASDYYQAASANLDSLSGVASTAYGRGFLTLVNQAGLMGLVQAASETVQGKVELATVAEATTGTDAVRAVTPAGVTARVNNLVPAATETAAGKVELATAAETVTGTDTTRAAHPAGVAAAISTAVSALVDSSPGTLDTLRELATALGDDPAFATTVTTALSNRLRVDAAQALTEPQKQQGRDNLDVYSKAEVGSVNTDYVALVQAALA